MQPVFHRLGLFLALLLGMLVLASCGGAQVEPKGKSSDPFIERGGRLYQENCQSCHAGATGGSLKDIPARHNANGHTWQHADQQLMDMILNGISFSLEEQKMPPFQDKLTEEDVQAILAYIKTWWTEEQREYQRQVTAQWGQ